MNRANLHSWVLVFCIILVFFAPNRSHAQEQIEQPSEITQETEQLRETEPDQESTATEPAETEQPSGQELTEVVGTTELSSSEISQETTESPAPEEGTEQIVSENITEASAPEPVQEVVEEPQEELPRGTFVVGRFLLKPMVEVRERFEARVNPYTAGGAGDDSYFVGSRARLGLDARFEFIRIVVQFADARNFGQFRVGVDGGATTGLHQGFFDISFGNHFLRIGRQEVNYGRQRLIGALNWTTSGRSFDALRLRLQFDGSSLDFFGAVTSWVRRVTEVDDSVVPPAESSTLTTGDYLAAVYFAWASLDAIAIDGYVLFRHDGATDGDVDRNRNIASPGVRIHGKPFTGFSYDLEGVFQAGGIVDEVHLAVATAAEVSYVIQVPMRPGFGLGFSFASGGGATETLTEFDNFFPTNHLYYGAADLFGWRNLLHGFFKISTAPTEIPFKFSINNHVFALAEPDDRWSNAGGATLGQNPDNDDRFLGYELDLNVGYIPRPWLKLSAGYAVFLPAQAAENLGHSQPTHWAYFMIGSVLP